MEEEKKEWGLPLRSICQARSRGSGDEKIQSVGGG